MNVGELIERLSAYPKNTPILLSTDEEGNGFNLLSNVEEHLYDPSEYYTDQIYPTHQQLDELIAVNKYGYTEEDRAPENSVPVLVLWP